MNKYLFEIHLYPMDSEDLFETAHKEVYVSILGNRYSIGIFPKKEAFRKGKDHIKTKVKFSKFS